MRPEDGAPERARGRWVRSLSEQAGGWWLLRCLFVMFALATTLQGIRPMISYRAVALGAGPGELGLVAASFAAISLVIAMPAGRWVDRWGETRFLMAGSAVMVMAALSLRWVDSLPTLALAHGVLGVGQILTALGAQTLVAGGGPASGRDARFGMLSIAVSLGLVTGPAVSGALAGARGGPDTVFLLGAAVMVVGFAVAASFRLWPPRGVQPHRQGAPPEGMLRSSAKLLRLPTMPQAMLASFIVLGCLDILVAYLPAYGEATGIPVRTVGLLLSCQAAAALVARVVMVPLISLVGRRRFLATCLLLPGVGIAAIPLTANVGVLFALMAVVGFGLGVGQPLTISWVATRAPAQQRGAALGIRQTGNRFGQLAIPAAGGLLAGATGLVAIFWAVAALLSTSALVVFRTDFEGAEAAGEP